VAAVEQHGPHLPVGVDTYIAQAYLARVRALLGKDSPATILPVQAVGASDEHKGFPGTLTLSPETALRAFIEIGASVHRAGINKLVIVNSHGGNLTIIDLAARQLRVRHAMLAVHCSWGRFGYPEGLFSQAERTHGIHGGDIETSIMLAAYPDLVRRDKVVDFKPTTYRMERDYKWLRADFPAGFGWMTQDLHASGAVGDASLATAEKGEAALAHGAKAFVELLEDVDKFDSDGLAIGPLDTGPLDAV
jgi:creatinine amidohydrolase